MSKDHNNVADHINKSLLHREWIWVGGSLLLLILGLILEQFNVSYFQVLQVRLVWYGLAYLLVGARIVLKAYRRILHGDIFNEFFLMSIATLGAFVLGEFPEGVTVMLFYTIGELVQDMAVSRAKRSIEALLKVQSEEVTVLRGGQAIVTHPKDVSVDEIIRIHPGGKVPLDGKLLTAQASFDAAALTGESVPQVRMNGEEIWAGMVNLHLEVDIKVTHPFTDTKLSRILSMVQHAAARKAPTQRFISRFARVYTPIVVGLAVAIACGPALFVSPYIWQEWAYRALVFLVISCPCALVISIPLGYFGGIGAASRHGLLFKGANFLDITAKLDAVVTDKTGTLTEGVFKVQEVHPTGITEQEMLQLAAALEDRSTHPVAQALVNYARDRVKLLTEVERLEEIPGHGLLGWVNGKEILVGNTRLLKRFNIAYDPKIDAITETTVVLAINKCYAGYITIADQIKEDAVVTVKELRALGVKDIIMLSGDKQSIVDKVAREVGIREAYGGLLPEDKARLATEIKARGRTMAFVGDGVNDAPVVALADVGVAMGGLGADATIETADLVIQTDKPSRLATAIRIGRATRKVVWQNIGLAFGVKLIVMAMGAVGIATMWEAVFADVGVALLAILNAAYIQRRRWQ